MHHAVCVEAEDRLRGSVLPFHLYKGSGALELMLPGLCGKPLCLLSHHTGPVFIPLMHLF